MIHVGFALLSAAQVPSPLTPEEERASFRLPPGFAIELVVSEPAVKKLVDIAFDDAGRLWATTAMEYPRDANEDPSASELYRGGGRDEVLVFERTSPGATAESRLVPRVFADGLAMPMSVLPLPEGAIVQHGGEILLLSDRDGDGRADAREVLFSGFGVQDSHLMPHRFLRGPDGWIYTAQGAFNASLVRDRSGRETRFEQCKLARFTRDGSRFEIVGAGLNNIWGIVFDERGRFVIQEANDLGYAATPFERFASFPGIGMDRIRPHAPWEPPPGEIRLGGTGLSGLALAEGTGGFPDPWHGRLIVANPIVRAVQSLSLRRGENGATLERGPDLIESSDERFRPIAVHFGPDECLYVVDWYNPVISHNEVPRTDPARDRVRTRLWRVRRADVEPATVFDAVRATPGELLAALSSTRTGAARAAWHQIVDRSLADLVPELRALALDKEQATAARMLALWSLEGLRAVDEPLLGELLAQADPDLGREALRGLAAEEPGEARLLALGTRVTHAPEARREWIRALGDLREPSDRVLLALLAAVEAPLAGETVRCEQGDVLALRGAAHARAFERFLVRKALEPHANGVRRVLDSGAELAPEAVALAALVLADAPAAERLALAMDALGREPSAEELALIAGHGEREAVSAWIGARLEGPGAQALVATLLETDGFAPREALRNALARRLAALDDTRLVARAAERWKLAELGPRLAAALEGARTPREVKLAALRALEACRDRRTELFARVARSSIPGDELQLAALHALASSGAADAARLALELCDSTTPTARSATLGALATTTTGALALLDALERKLLGPETLDARLRETLAAKLASDASAGERLAKLTSGAAAGFPVLRLPGGADDYGDSDVSLDGPFTLEAWIQLDEGVSNADGILCLPGEFDWNFADGRPRLWQGPTDGDVVIARRRVEAGRWTHVALTRAADGTVSLYLDGELDAQSAPRPSRAFAKLDVGRTTPGGCAARIAELRVWNVCRTGLELAADRLRAFDSRRPAGLERVFPGDELALHGAAALETSFDFPRLLDEAQWNAERELLARYAALARSGNREAGRPVFERTCLACHAVGGRGESVGPPLDGVGTRGVESLVATILRPSAAVEAGYRLLRVELDDETLLEGLLFAQDDASLTLREASAAGARPPRRIPREEIARLRWSNLSVMPEGLLQALSDREAADLLAFVAALR